MQCLDIVSLDCMPLLSIFKLVLLLNKEITIMAAMKRLQDMGASYFILDLRDNLGGLVQVCLLNLCCLDVTLIEV